MTTRPMAMRDAFLTRIADAMATDEKIFFLSADFGSPVLDRIRADYPDRFANVGIAEQNLINVAAGLALEGYKVFAYAIAPFITMRCYEQIRVSLALLSEVRPMNVTLIGVGAGYSYVVSGPTHQCFEDLSIMRALPNMGFHSPADHVTAAALFDGAVGERGVKYLRLDAQVLPVLYEGRTPDVARGYEVLREGDRIAIVATGFMVHTALKVAEALATQGIEVAVIDLFRLSSPHESLAETLGRYAGIVSLEEGFRGRGGLDAMLFDYSARHRLPARLVNVGVQGTYHFELGTRAELHEHVGIGVNAVTEAVSDLARQLDLAPTTGAALHSAN